MILESLNKYLKDVSNIKRIKFIKENSISPNLNQIQMNAFMWGKEIKNNTFMLAIGKSLAENNLIKFDNLEFTHSLTTGRITWLIGHEEIFGDILVVQKNFSIEAIFFSDLELFLSLPPLKYCEKHKHSLLVFFNQLKFILKNNEFKNKLISYLLSKPKYGGFIFHYLSPFHCMAFGHTGLLKYQMNNLNIKTNVKILKYNCWIDPSQIFPNMILNTKEYENSDIFLELQEKELYFYFKAGYRYDPNEKDLNETFDAICLELGQKYKQKIKSFYKIDENKTYLWIGLTSGKRQLINESEIVLETISTFNKYNPIDGIFIDGWTSSSLSIDNIEKEDIIVSRSQPYIELYKDHHNKFEFYKSIIEKNFPNIKVISAVGIPYEYKIAMCSLCKFAVTSAYTNSIVPSRICGIKNIIHSSNLGRNPKMHIYKNSEYVPEELILDFPEKNTHHLDVNYKIKITEYKNWINSKIFNNIK